MSISDRDGIIAQTTRTLQIIVASLVMGLLMFLGITLFLNLNQPVRPPGPPRPPSILLPLAFVIAAGSLLASVLVPRLMVAGERRKIADGTWTPAPRSRRNDREFVDVKSIDDEAKLAGVYQTQLIVAAALTEGPAFFALIVYLMEKSPSALGLALALIAALIFRIPTRDKVEQWIDRQGALIQQERQLGSP